MWWVVFGLIVAGVFIIGIVYIRQMGAVDSKLKTLCNTKATQARMAAEDAKAIAAKSRQKDAATAAQMAVNAANVAIVTASQIKVGQSAAHVKSHIANLDEATALAERAARVTSQISFGDFDEWYRFSTLESLRVCGTTGELEAIAAQFHMGAIYLAEGNYTDGIKMLRKCSKHNNYNFVYACLLLRNVYAADLPELTTGRVTDLTVDDSMDDDTIEDITVEKLPVSFFNRKAVKKPEEIPDWGFLAEGSPFRFRISDMPYCIVEYPVTPEGLADTVAAAMEAIKFIRLGSLRIEAVR